MAPPPSSLLRDLLVADGFKNRRRPPEGSAPAASRASSIPLQQRRPGKTARSQSDVLTRSRLREMNGDPDGAGRDAYGDERRASTATRRSSASQTSVRSYSNKGASDGGGAGDRRSSVSASAAVVPALDESALTVLISLAAGGMKRFVKDEAFRASCLGDSNHRAVLDLRVHAQTVERAAREGLDPRDLKRASLKLHEVTSLDAGDADAVTASGVPYPRLAACAHLYMSAVSKLQRRDHSAAVHALEAFCLAPREARTLLLPALWDRLFRSGLSHLRTWRDRESAAASSDERAKEVEKTFVDVVDDGTRVLACYYRDSLLGRTDAMALPDAPAPPSTVHASAPRCSASTSYDISSDVVFSSGGSSPVKFVYDGAMQKSEEIEEEDRVHAMAAHAESVFHECEAGEARSYPPALQVEENVLTPNNIVKQTSEPQVEDEPIKESDASTSYRPISDISAIDLLTLEFCEGPLPNDTDGNHFSVFATVPSDFLCPLTRQIFRNPVTIETGQTFERHAIVQWLDRGFRTCPVTGQELLSSSIPDTNRVLRRLINSWKSERCKNLVSGSTGPEEKLTVTVIDKVFDSAGDMSEKLDKARHLMEIGGIDFLLHRFQEGGGDEQQRVAEHLLFCISAEGSCRNYVAIKIDGSSVLRLLHNEVLSARGTAVCLLTELICLRRREMFELLLRGLGTESVVQTMDVLLEHLRSLPVREQAPVAVLLLHLEALVEANKDSTYREEAAKIITQSLRCCMSDDNAVAGTRKALLLLAGHFSFSGDLLAEDWMLKQAGFVDASRAGPINSDAVVQDKEAAGNEAWLRYVTAALLGSSGVRRPFLEALSRCLGSPDADLVGACLTTAGWLSRSLAASLDGDAADAGTSLAARPAAEAVPGPRPAGAAPGPRRRVAAQLQQDPRELLVLLADGLRDHLADLAQLTGTAGQLSAELHERH
ncbi:putative E3 ubiquitin-protein ligase LIN [Panicum miliaceum]|uniref:E3 ubiquitin-protein ligase LIN n=1 Tax=Panicum miliaceum TaxID=4540 RepID=A0A3L6PXZ0_PANMI|nr:putative E3 ubiquitin-protein ligase LIN [Panicum miliaceum]